ncbi:MAG: energy-coupling factor ABC transporter substrate-binding protein [Spirochaetaceae bacterium]|jgi:cobalt/nickel transport protein|nr:energy-coupling factor ABC transporter substrate-binding protein [Spirochaetaceae bacterium]
MKKNQILNLLLIFLSIVIVIIPLNLIKDSDFDGADEQAEKVIIENSPSYKPWFFNLWEPTGGEMETLLFSLQAAIGSGVLFFGLGYFMGKRRGSR